MRLVATALLVAAMLAAFSLPAWAEMVNGSEVAEEPAVVFQPLGATPLGPGEAIFVWYVKEGDQRALIVLHVWIGGRELVVMPW